MASSISGSVLFAAWSSGSAGHTAIYTEALEEEIGIYRTVGIVARSRLTALSRAPGTKA
jgi:hypothetical protein